MPSSLGLPHRSLLSFSMVIPNNLSFFLCCLLQADMSSLCQYSECRFVYSDEDPDALKPGPTNTMLMDLTRLSTLALTLLFSFNWLSTLVAQLLTRAIKVLFG